MRKISTRMCVTCRQMREKCDLIRVNEYNGEFAIDSTKKYNGRGAYVCKNRECIIGAIKKKKLNRAFKCAIPQKIYDELMEIIDEQ